MAHESLRVQKVRRSESCKFRARFALLVIIPNWLEVGFRNPPTEQPDTVVDKGSDGSVGETKAGAPGESPLPLDLQSVVLGIDYAFLFLNGGEALVGTKRVDIHAGIRQQTAHRGHGLDGVVPIAIADLPGRS
jgi:hypothetical protein